MSLRLLASSLLGLSATFASASRDDEQTPFGDYRHICPDYTRYSGYPQYVIRPRILCARPS
jgi:hypothetical protein